METLSTLAAIADDIEATEIARDARALASRLAEGRFFLTAVGQFKRGKSTLLNALIGEDLLPTGVTPVTSAITIVRYGPERTANVVFRDGRRVPIPVSDVHAFVTEVDNPENVRHVSAVEVFSPSPLLARRVCLVDTPGLGSVFEGNTQEARAFIPHIDAALVVLGADPPISGDELHMVSDIASQVSHLFFVLNKADRLSTRDLADARRFTEEILQRHLRQSYGPIFEVSATERLSNGATRDWAALETRLGELASGARAVVEQSCARGVTRLTSALRRDIAEQRGALLRPLEESQQRIVHLEESTQCAERLLLDLAALFRSEEQRIVSGALDTAHAMFVAAAGPEITRDVGRAVEALAPTQPAGSLRAAAYTAARGIVEHRVRVWLTQIEPHAETWYREAAVRFVALANDFLRSLAATDDVSFGHLPKSIDPEAGFRGARRFFFTDLMHLTGTSPIEWIGDRVRGRSASARSVGADAIRYADRLLEANSSRVVFDVRERLSESRAALESELRATLTALTASARRALDMVRQARAGGSGSVRTQVSRLDDALMRLNALG